MQSVLVIGAGGVGHVTIHKMGRLSKGFTNIILITITWYTCSKIKNNVQKKYNFNVTIIELNAYNINESLSIINKFKPFLVVNLALPYQDLNLMDACLITKTHYLDTANYEPKDEAKFEYKRKGE